MKNIHALHICLNDKYGEDWADKIHFINEKLKESIKLLYIKDYPGKDIIITNQNQRKELYKKIKK